jgi:hypothetical protein
MAFDVQDTLSLSAQDVPLGTSTSQQNGRPPYDLLRKCLWLIISIRSTRRLIPYRHPNIRPGRS